VGLLLGLLAVAPGARADDDDVPNILPPPDHGARTLRGHTFIEPATQDTAFVTSHVGLRQGVAYFSVPRFPLTVDRRADLSLIALEERLDLQVRITRWLGIHAAGEAVLATGLDQPSLFYGSTGFIGGGRGGPLVRLYRSRDSGTQVTVRAFYGAGAGNALALPGFVQAIAVRASNEANAGLPADRAQGARRLLIAVNQLSNAAVSATSRHQVGGSVHFAQTLTRAIGLQTSFALSRAFTADSTFDPESQQRLHTDSTDTTLRFAATVSVDAYHLRVPVALLGEYAAEKTYRVLEAADVHVPSGHFFGLGVYYSGRTDLQLGVSAFVRRNLKALDVTAVDGTRAMTGVPTELHGQFVLRYIWN